MIGSGQKGCCDNVSCLCKYIETAHIALIHCKCSNLTNWKRPKLSSTFYLFYSFIKTTGQNSVSATSLLYRKLINVLQFAEGPQPYLGPTCTRVFVARIPLSLKMLQCKDCKNCHSLLLLFYTKLFGPSNFHV